MLTLRGADKSDAATLLREAARVYPPRRSLADAESIREITIPDLRYWKHDPVAQLAFSVLDKAPLPISELAHRMSLSDQALADVLFDARSEVGDLIDVIALKGPEGRMPLRRAFNDDGQPRSLFTSLAPVRGKRIELAELILNSLASKVAELRQTAGQAEE